MQKGPLRCRFENFSQLFGNPVDAVGLPTAQSAVSHSPKGAEQTDTRKRVFQRLPCPLRGGEAIRHPLFCTSCRVIKVGDVSLSFRRLRTVIRSSLIYSDSCAVGFRLSPINDRKRSFREGIGMSRFPDLF